MSILSSNALFNFEDWFKQIRETEAASDSLGESFQTWLKFTRSGIEAATKELAELEEQIRRTGITQKNATGILAEYDRKLDQAATRLAESKKLEGDLTEARRLNNQVINDLTAKLTDLQRRLQALDPTQKDYEKQQRAILREVKTVTSAIDAQGKSLKVAKSTMDAAEGSVDRLRKETNELKKVLNGLPNAYEEGTGAINRQNKAAVALNEQYQKNLTLLKKIEQGQGISFRNVGNYPKGQDGTSMLSAGASIAGRAAGAGLAIAGLDSVFSAVQKVGEITLQFDSLDSALKVVSNDTALYAQRQAMLQRISEDLGQDLAVVEENYTMLTAASKETNLEGAQTDQIFESIVGTMGRLKRPTEDTRRALLAVSQIISKGSVQSEELKGQIGETVAGAFNVAARSIGVTTMKLSEMLKNGEVMASDFLPKFAAELEKTFNPNHERRVEGLAANLARMRNEGVAWVKTFNIGDGASSFIGYITSMARSVRQQFTPAVELSTARLADQTETLKRLEGQLPGLLQQYDELKSKSKLSADEQRTLQTVINDITLLAPSAATGFDAYGNALDINKSKVLSFTQAQRDLNAELNKQVIKDSETQFDSLQQQKEQRQKELNRGTKQTFRFKPYFLQSDEEKRLTTGRNQDEGKRREVPLTDADILQRQSQNQADTKQQELALARKIQFGGKMRDEDIKFINESKNIDLKKYVIAQEFNDKIKVLEEKRLALFSKTDKQSIKEREGVIKQMKALESQRDEILYPTLANKTAKAEEKPGLKQSEIDKQMRDALAKAKSVNDLNLSRLNDDRQDGLVDEQTFIEKRLQITLKGANERLAILSRAGKKETDDYLNVLREKEKAETEYKRSQLQLDLKTSQASTDKKVSALDTQHSDGDLSDIAYVEQRHATLKEGFQQRLAIIKEAGQGESELYRTTNQQQLDEEADYQRRRFKAFKKSWEDIQSEVKSALKAVNESTEAGLTESLNTLERDFTKDKNKIRLDVAKNKITPQEGEAKGYALEMKYLKDQSAAYETAYQKDRQLNEALIDDKIEKLKNLRDYGMLNGAEIAEANKQLADLEKLRTHEAADDKMALDKKVTDNANEQSDRRTDHEIKNIDKAKLKRDMLLQKGLEFAGAIGETMASITNSNLERESQQAQRMYDNQMKLVGDNADAKTRIEEQYAKKKAELARKQAVADREAALFNVAISAAMGVASVLSTGGGTRYADFGISAGLLTAFVLGTAALQTIAILSKPLPAYAKGRSASDSYEGPALAGEAGTELYVDREGASTLLHRPTIINTKRGDVVYTAAETRAILEGRDKITGALALSDSHKASTNNLRAGHIVEQVFIQQEAGASGGGATKADIYEGVSQALSEQPKIINQVDADGQHTYYQGIDGKIEYLNKRHR